MLIVLELCKSAYNWYCGQDCENKRRFLKLICSNFFYDGQNLTIAIKNTFKSMLESDGFSNGGLKATKLELIANKIYDEVTNPDNVLLFEQIKLLLSA